MSAPSLTERVDALDAALDLAAGRLDDARLVDARHVLGKVRERMGHGTEHTVVALGGPTGVGKSTLFNALVGEAVSTTGVRRPTTSVAHAAVWGAADPALLDWLGVGARHHVAVEDDHPLRGLVLVDLPDFDSTQGSHRLEVDRLVELVDLVIWVTDPQKYADEAFHEGYVRPTVAYSQVMRFVVNKIDTVPTEQHRTLLDDAERRIADDGVPAPVVLAMSTELGVGVDAVRHELSEAVSQRRAVTERLEVDVRGAALRLDPGGELGEITRQERRRFVERIGHATGVDSVGATVAAQHRHDARAVMGWPPAKLIARWRRRHPIADLPRATASGAAGSEIDLALRDLAESAAADAAPPWPGVLRATASSRADDLRSQLTSTTQHTAREMVGRPRWWSLVGTVQAALAAAALAGAVWLLVVSVLAGFFHVDADPLLIETPGAEWIPVPSLLVLGGLAIGLLVALLTRAPVALASRRRARRVRSLLLDRVGEVADRTVVADLREVLADRRALLERIAVAAAPPGGRSTAGTRGR